MISISPVEASLSITKFFARASPSRVVELSILTKIHSPLTFILTLMITFLHPKRQLQSR